MKRVSRIGVCICLLLLAAVAALAFLVTRYRVPEIIGTWKNRDSDYYIVFDSDGTYTESTYNIPCTYSVEGDKLVLNDVAGQQTTVSLCRTFGGYLELTLNGVDYVMEPSQDTPHFYQWGSEAAPQHATIYELGMSYDTPCRLELADDRGVTISIGSNTYYGKYALPVTGDILLLFDAGEHIEVLKKTATGYALGALETSISATEVAANALEARGYQLTGTVYSPLTRVEYEFQGRNGTVIKTAPNGSKLEFSYYVDPTGIITMTDSAGRGVEDTMWYDSAFGVVYRYIFDLDAWQQYLEGMGTGGDINVE